MGPALPGSAIAPLPVPDPDGDRILGACDVCPDQAEGNNDYAIDDGCPESEADIQLVSADPSNRYSGPLFQVQFSSDGPSVPLDRAWQLDDEIEAVACVVAAPSAVLANQRAGDLCKPLRAGLGRSKVEILDHGTTRPAFYKDDHTGRGRPTDHGIGVVQVMRARGVEVWRWQQDRLVRIAKPRILESRPLPTGCSWVSFERDATDGTWSACPSDGCDQNNVLEGYRARWGAAPRYPR